MQKHRLCVLASFLLALTAAGAAQAADISLERIVADPPLSGGSPRQVQISGGGNWISELRPSAEDPRQLELWARPIKGGEAKRLVSAAELLNGRTESLSDAERMLLERKRISDRGITSYQWCGKGDDKLLLPFSGDLYLVRIGKGVQRLTQDAEVPEQDPSCSSDGAQIAYVKGGNLWVQSIEGGAAPRQLTQDGGANNVAWGLAEFAAAEELSRFKGYWWSPDGKGILALRVDESDVPLKTRARIFSDRTEMSQQRYPAAGMPNAKVTAWRIDLPAGKSTALPLGGEAEYISNAGWFADGTPWLQWLTRDQKRTAVTEFSPASAAPRVVIDERDPIWVEDQHDLAELADVKRSGKPALLWNTEASGRHQLVLVDRVTGKREALTNEPEPVQGVVCNDGHQVVYSAARERGRAHELFVISPGAQARAIDGAAEHQWRSAVGDKSCKQLIVNRSAWGQPNKQTLQAVAGGAAQPLAGGAAADPLLAQIVPEVQALDVIAADGKTILNGFYMPPLAGTGPRPVITLAYGGPGSSTVHWAYGRDLPLIAHWQRLGYGVFMIDTRGMSGRDRAFTRAHDHAFGVMEVADLFTAVRQLPNLVANKGEVDPARIGFWGWSYGGFLAARAMLDSNTPFASAVAVAAPTDWTLYDTAYTERYLGMPEDGKAEAYVQGNLVKRAKLLEKPLLIAHGTADDNVLFEHSLRLIEALQKEGKVFQTDIYPGLAHGLAGGPGVRLHLYRTLDDFFARTLKP